MKDSNINPQSNLDFIVGRLVNKTKSAEGSILPPRQIGSLRVPLVTNLRILRSQTYFGGTQFSLAWDEPTGALNSISHFSVYVLGLLTNNTQPSGPFVSARSPAELRVQSKTAVPVVFTVQTVLKNGQVSDIGTSPSVSGFTVESSLVASDFTAGTVPVLALEDGTYRELITWDAAGVVVATGSRGVATVNFAAFQPEASLTIAGQTELLSTSQITLTISATTDDMRAQGWLSPLVRNVVVGTGFDITIRPDIGSFKGDLLVNWSWI